MKEIYRDSLTRLEVDDDFLYIHHNGKNGNVSFTEIQGVRGRSSAAFVAPNALKQPIEQVIVDTLTQPEAFVLDVPGDGDGDELFALLTGLRIV